MKAFTVIVAGLAVVAIGVSVFAWLSMTTEERTKLILGVDAIING